MRHPSKPSCATVQKFNFITINSKVNAQKQLSKHKTSSSTYIAFAWYHFQLYRQWNLNLSYITKGDNVKFNALHKNKSLSLKYYSTNWITKPKYASNLYSLFFPCPSSKQTTFITSLSYICNINHKMLCFNHSKRLINHLRHKKLIHTLAYVCKQYI